jgi:hypothetical protein
MVPFESVTISWIEAACLDWVTGTGGLKDLPASLDVMVKIWPFAE